jgi:two-component system, chemotaxis family, CheB/CheR fusion protein
VTVPIVAIAASAGGLEALSELLAALPAQCGLACIVVQHLDPDHESLLAEILAKKTNLLVMPAHDGVVVEPDHVYVIPPNTTLRMTGDRIGVTPRVSGRHHPADILFASLAEEHGDGAIGVVLSGGDTDGALGIQAIKHGGGITFAQEPASARFPSMPRNAIATGCVDFVLRPNEIAQELTRLSRHPYLRSTRGPEANTDKTTEAPVGADEEHLRHVFRRLRTAHGVDFSHYKRNTLVRRLARRMALQKTADLADYVALIGSDPAEAAALYQDFLIRVTGFFRDPQSFVLLAERVFPRLSEGRSRKMPIRIWVPGCASGEEVYSIAITLIEYLGDRIVPGCIQIFGTDVSEVEIEKARSGIYLDSIALEVSSERLQRFFARQGDHFRIAKSVRELCIFARHDVTRDPPFSRLDLVSCRNLLIYLDASAQRRVMQVFHYALRPQGFLILGPSESVGQAADLFELADKQLRLYTRGLAPPGAGVDLTQRATAPASRAGEATIDDAPILLEADSPQREADRLLLARYAPASLLVEYACCSSCTVCGGGAGHGRSRTDSRSLPTAHCSNSDLCLGSGVCSPIHRGLSPAGVLQAGTGLAIRAARHVCLRAALPDPGFGRVVRSLLRCLSIRPANPALTEPRPVALRAGKRGLRRPPYRSVRPPGYRHPGSFDRSLSQ